MEERISQMSHLLSFYECESGIVLDQFLVESKKTRSLLAKHYYTLYW